MGPKRRNDIYVTKYTNFNSQLERCEILLKARFKEIVIHGLGTAIIRAINLATRVKERFNNKVDISIHTSTVEFENRDDCFGRFESCIHLKVFKVDTNVDIEVK